MEHKGDGHRDIVELKRPDMEVLVYDETHRNFYFAAEASKAIGQCHRYLDVLHEKASKGLDDHPEIVAYHPRATIVMGRSHDWLADKSKALHGLNRRLNGITLITYDQLVAQGERLVAMVVDDSAESSKDPFSFDVSEDEPDDDIPF